MSTTSLEVKVNRLLNESMFKFLKLLYVCFACAESQESVVC